MSSKYEVCRNNKLVVFEAVQDGLAISFQRVKPSTGKAVAAHEFVMSYEDIDLLANSLVDPLLYQPGQPTFTIRMPEHYLSVSLPKKDTDSSVSGKWMSRIVSCDHYNKSEVISTGLSPVECYRLSKFCDRLALIDLLRREIPALFDSRVSSS